MEALVTAAGLEWSEVDELSEEDVSTTRAASRGPCVAQSHQGVRGRRESGLGHAAATCYRGGVSGRAAYGCARDIRLQIGGSLGPRAWGVQPFTAVRWESGLGRAAATGAQ